MDRADVIELFIEIKSEYPNFDDSDEEIDRHLRYMKDFPFEAALENVVHHIKTNRWPPGISDIRGRLGDQIDSQRSKQAAAVHLERLEGWRQLDEPPPPGYWENMRKLIKGAGNEGV
ncbi:hypothetical protein [Paenibacillus daejeonensis]|uniref:hypothetical protein n=1 Tax=Paenibacillus daejeonensis TaxID=135193 RepID=UPI000366D280|nr:hypothetical protein [Paenibacillus daejeonensis]